MESYSFPTSLIIFYLLYMALMIVATWKLFEKAGQPGWACIIPFYNIYIMTKIAGKPGWWVLMLFIPFVNFIFGIWLLNMISKSFGKDEGYTVALIFLGFIFWPMLGLGSAKYAGPYGDPVAFRAYQDPHFDFQSNTTL